jgi:hypothetical protein
VCARLGSEVADHAVSGGSWAVSVGHGEGIFEGARGALSEALDGARVRFPAALANLPAELRAMLGAVAEEAIPPD